MKKSLAVFFTVLLTVLSPFETFATTLSSTSLTPIAKYSWVDRSKTMTVKDFFTVAFSVIGDFEEVPKTSKYIQLRYRGIIPETELYFALQKGVYLNLIENIDRTLPLRATATEGLFVKILERVTNEPMATAVAEKALTYGVLFDTLSDLYEETTPSEGIQSADGF